MAATFDFFSGGRLEFGIGAGTQEAEHTAYGFDFFRPDTRIERLAEALEVTRQLWTQEKSNYQGKYYLLKNAVCEPKPLQKPYPPITVGGSGEFLMQKATAPYADRFDWGFLPSTKEYKRKLGVLEKQCKVVGRNFDKIEKSCWPGGQVIIAHNHKELNEKISQRKPANVNLEDFRKCTLAGTPDECIEQLQVYVGLGVTCFMLFFGDLPRLDGLKLFAEDVIEKMS
jgi:alkanesulfonate monooxygenase SsuD/methylene tetrahydromethanopterin reductase-like flavin-dependent oxidoreductase (luciferase family)